MKRLVRFLSVGVALTLLGSALPPTLAQDANPAAGQGGTVVISNIGDDPKTFNPVISNDNTSATVTALLFPDIIGVDDRTLEDTAGASNGLAESWEYDETGTKLTVHLRQDLTWSDGVPVTADDYLWALNAVKTGKTSSPRVYVFYQLDDGTVTDGGLFDYTKIDDYTIEFTIGAAVKDAEGNWTGEVVPSCVALSDLNDIGVVPAHIFGPKYDADLSAMDTDPYFFGATAGAFKDPYLEFGVQVSLLADQAWPDSQLGYISPGEWIYRQVENSNVEYDRFLSGDFTFIPVSSNKQNEFRDIAADRGFQTIEYPGNGWTFMSYNLADPQNPQPGRDAEGNVLDQGLHPIFSDKLVRQAIAHGVDVLAMIGERPDGTNPGTGILQGNGYPVAVYNHPGLSWIDPGLDPYAFDQEAAGALLDEAGWKDEDGDGVRECHGCLYAQTNPEFEGSPLKFSLLTNSGNVTREATGETVKAQLAEIGIQVDYQAIEFGALVDQFTAQTYDAIIIGWNLGLPFDPDGSSVLFGVGSDVPGSGFNTASYYNEEYETLLDEGKSLPGCDRTERTAIYKRTLEILYDEQPMLWLYATNTLIAAQPTVVGWDPLPYNASWNLDAWTIGD